MRRKKRPADGSSSGTKDPPDPHRLKLSVIIVTFNRVDDVNLTPSLLQDQDTDFELVLVDNGSTAGGEINLEGWRDAHLIRFDANRGVAAGRNAGIRLATGDILVFLDDDASFVCSGTLSRIRERFREDRGLGILAADSRIYPSGDIEVAAIPRRDKRVFPGDYRTSYFCGVSFAARRSVLEETGGFFEPLFIYGEELDLSWRVLDKGYRIVRASDYVVFHRLSVRARSMGRWIYQNARNRVWIALLYLPRKYVASYALFWWTYLFGKSLREGTVPAFLRGVQDCLQGMPSVRKRREVFKAETIDVIRRLNGRIPY